MKTFFAKPARLALLGLCLFAAWTSAVRAADATKPNVVLIISDDQAWTDYGFMGHDVIKTPRLDRLAAESATYRRGYVPTSLCRPSLSTMATGLYAHQHGVTGNDPAGRTSELRERLIAKQDTIGTIPKILGRAGYVSHQSGKWWEGSFRRAGYTAGMTRGFPEPGGRHGDDGLKIGRNGMEPVFSFIDDAVDQEKPFFVWYAPFLPHSPHNPPERLLKKYEQEGRPIAIAKYYAMCEWFDETCGQLLDKLDEKGVADNTIVLYVCDNGWIQNPKSVGRFAPRSKQTPYEGGVRTPIMVRWPGKTKAKMDATTLVSSIDLLPTILDACGLDIPKNLPGKSLLDDAQGKKPLDRDAIFGEAFAHDIADIDDATASLRCRWCIDGKWKLLLGHDGKLGSYGSQQTPVGPIMLFDLQADPHEKVNLAEENPEIVARLTKKINEWWPIDQQVSVEKKVQATPVSLRKSDTRPNILFFLIDDQRNDTLGCAGHPVIKTPNVDRLAASGVRFENMFVTTSICAASRASIFTGMTERTHGYTFGKPPVCKKHIDESYGAMLRGAGYRTGHIGKFGVSLEGGRASIAAMFDVFNPLNRHPYHHKMPDGSTRHESERCGDFAEEFIASQPKGQPFCLQVSFNAVHAEDADHRPGVGHYPWPKAVDGMYEDIAMAPPRLGDPAIFEALPKFMQESMNRARWHWRWDTKEKYETNMRAYFRMISGVDNVIGRVLKKLEDEGLADNTIVIYTGDNGYYMGDRGFAGKWSHYEQSLRVPLIIYDPRLPEPKRGQVVSPMSLNIDLPATMLDIAGVKVPVGYQGHTLMPIVRDELIKEEPRVDFFCEHLMSNKSIPKWEGVRDQRYVYANYFGQNPPYEFLHDLKTDPDQLKNLIDDPAMAKVLETLRARTAELREKYEKARPLRN